MQTSQVHADVPRSRLWVPCRDEVPAELWWIEAWAWSTSVSPWLVLTSRHINVVFATIIFTIPILITTTILPRSVSNSVPHVDLLRTKLGRLHRPSSSSIKIANLGGEKSWGTCNLWEDSISFHFQFQVVRRGGRTVGVSVLLAPHPGELARSCLPGAKEDGLITSTIRFPLFCAFSDQNFLAAGFFSPISGSWPRNKGLCVKCSFLSLRVQEVTNQLLIGLVILYKMSWQASELLQRYLETNLLHSKPCSWKCSGVLQVWGQDEDPLPKRAQKICCSSLRLFLQLLHHRHGEISFQFWILILSTLMLQDILFDAKNNKVKKFILHTNFPGHYNFNM